MSLLHERSAIQNSNEVKDFNGNTVRVIGGRVPTIRIRKLGAAAEIPKPADEDTGDKTPFIEEQ